MQIYKNLSTENYAIEVVGSMQEIIYKCDHCGKTIDPMHDYDDAELDLAHHWYRCDLCSDCLKELCDMVEKYINAVED